MLTVLDSPLRSSLNYSGLWNIIGIIIISENVFLKSNHEKQMELTAGPEYLNTPDKQETRNSEGKHNNIKTLHVTSYIFHK
jgi:hypothetical protein